MTTLPPPVDTLAAWVGQSIEADDPRAAAVLSAATNLVHGYTGKDWSTDDAPADVVDIVVQVAERKWLNPNPNVKNQTSGPFTQGFFDAVTQGIYLTDADMSVLNRFRATASGLGTISVTRDGGGLDTIYVPTAPDPAGYPFPWYAADGY